jgi:hypothetical protein
MYRLVQEMAIATEVFQIAYIVVTAVIIAKERVDKPQMIKERS